MFFLFSLLNMTDIASLGPTRNVRRFPSMFVVVAVSSRKERRSVLTERLPPLSRSPRRPVTFIQWKLARELLKIDFPLEKGVGGILWWVENFRFYQFSKGCNETCAKSETTRGVHACTETSLQPGVLKTKQGLSSSSDRVVSELSNI